MGTRGLQRGLRGPGHTKHGRRDEGQSKPSADAGRVRRRAKGKGWTKRGSPTLFLSREKSRNVFQSICVLFAKISLRSLAPSAIEKSNLPASFSACSRNRAVVHFGWVFFLISLGGQAPHVRAPLGVYVRRAKQNRIDPHQKA